MENKHLEFEITTNDAAEMKIEGETSEVLKTSEVLPVTQLKKGVKNAD